MLWITPPLGFFCTPHMKVLWVTFIDNPCVLPFPDVLGLTLSGLAPKDPGEKPSHKRNQFPRGTSRQGGQKASKNNPPDVDGHSKSRSVRRKEENPAPTWMLLALGSVCALKTKNPPRCLKACAMQKTFCHANRPRGGLSILIHLHRASTTIEPLKSVNKNSHNICYL